MMKREPVLFHIMLKQGFTWFKLTSNTQETVQVNLDTFPEWISTSKPSATFLPQLLLSPPQRHDRPGDDHPDGGWHPYLQEGQDDPGDFI